MASYASMATQHIGLNFKTFARQITSSLEISSSAISCPQAEPAEPHSAVTELIKWYNGNDAFLGNMATYLFMATWHHAISWKQVNPWQYGCMATQHFLCSLKSWTSEVTQLIWPVYFYLSDFTFSNQKLGQGCKYCKKNIKFYTEGAFLQCFLFGLLAFSLCMCCLGAKPAPNMGRLCNWLMITFASFFWQICRDFCCFGLRFPHWLFKILFSWYLPIKITYLGQMPMPTTQILAWYTSIQWWAIITR